MIGDIDIKQNNRCLFHRASIRLLLLVTFCCFYPAHATQTTATDQATAETVSLYYFWSRYCPHCQEAKPFIAYLVKTYPWLSLHSYDLVNNKANQELFISMAQALEQPANSVPAFIFCEQMMVGYDRAETSGQELEQQLIACFQKQNEHQHQESFFIPALGKVHYQQFSLPVFTFILAALDAFNPCAFFILFMLLSLMVHHRSRTRMLIIGGIFVLCSGIMYFLFMSAWLNLFLMTDQLVFITSIAGLVAVIFGLINIKDYFYFKQGVSLSLTDSAKSKLFTRIRTLTQSGNWVTMITATIVLAIAANSYELLCTAVLPMIFTRVLTLNDLSTTQYYLYLALYNTVYIIPLLLIVILFTLTMGNKKLSEQHGRLLKLLSGNMMLGLGAVLLLKPEWLSNMLVSVSVLLGSILLTLIVAFVKKLISSES